jgi:GxxExxY protein
MLTRTELNAISGQILDTSIRIHSRLGPGLLETVYESILARDLARLGHLVERQKPISFDFEGMWFQDAFRPDLLIDRAVVVEVKSAAAIAPVFEKQVLTYLRILDLRLGLLVNFGQATLAQGFRRIANGF